jgi:hypothetical protein
MQSSLHTVTVASAPAGFDLARAFRAARENRSLQAFCVQGAAALALAELFGALGEGGSENKLELRVRGWPHGPEILDALGAALRRDPDLCSLDLGGCPARAGLTALRALRTNARLWRLELRGCVRCTWDLAELREAISSVARARGAPLLLDLRENGLENPIAAAALEGVLPPGCGWALRLTEETWHAPPAEELLGGE